MRLLQAWFLLLACATGVLATGNATQHGDQQKNEKKTDKAQTPSEQFKALLNELKTAQAVLLKAHQEAKTDASREKIAADYAKLSSQYVARFLKLARDNPKDPVAYGALMVVVGATPSGPELDLALEMLLKDHVNKLGALCLDVAGSGSVTAEKFIRATLEKSTDHAVQGQATLALAKLLKGRSSLAETKPAEAQKLNSEAESLYEKVVTRFADVADLANRARPELFDLRFLSIGKQAQEVEGEDVDGKKFKLSDYRGKVVVLSFWGNWSDECRSLLPHQQRLVKRLEGKPFAFLGVSSDGNRELLRRTLDLEKITFRSWFDGGKEGPIAMKWQIHGWPTIYILDHRGVIRYKDAQGEALDKAVDLLLKELAEKK